MALDSTEQELFDFIWQSMPEWYRDRDRAQEEIAGFAKTFGAVKKTLAYWFDMCLIGVATGPELGDTGWIDAQSEAALGPDWLDFHAEDRATRRAAGETDAVMRSRLRSPPDAVTREALIALAQALVTASGVTGTVGMVEFPRDASYLGDYGQDSGTGGVLTKSLAGNIMTFVPSSPFAYPPYWGTVSGRVKSTQINLSGCASGGNDGSFDITGLTAALDTGSHPTLTGITFVNANGVAGTDATVTWTTSRLDHHGAVMDGYGRCYVNRGYRVWRGQTVAGEKKAMGGLLLILPYGTTEATRIAVREMLRKHKAAGFAGIVERNTVAP